MDDTNLWAFKNAKPKQVHGYDSNTWTKTQIAMTHIAGVLLHLVIWVMIARSTTTPEAVLTQVVLEAVLTLVAEACKWRSVASLTLHRMYNWKNTEFKPYMKTYMNV